MYEIIVVDGWPAFVKPDGTIRPFIGGGHDSAVAHTHNADGTIKFKGDDSDVDIRIINGIPYRSIPDETQPSGYRFIPISGVDVTSQVKPTTFELPALPGLIRASNGQYYVPDSELTGGKRLATYEEIIAAQAAAARTGTTTRAPMTAQEIALMEAQTANYYANIEQSRAAILQADARIKIDNERLALEIRNASFNQSRALYADARDDKRLAMEASRDLFTQQNSIANLQLNIAQMQQARSNLQSQIDWNIEQLNTNALNEAMRFNIQQQFAVEQANVSAQQRRQEQLQSLARDISEAAKAPGDYGKLAALTLANAGWGAANTAIGKGADVRTTESLAPLESQLRTRQSVMAQSDRPFTFTPITPTLAQRQVIAPLNLSGLTIPQIQKPPPIPVPIPALPGAGGGAAPAAAPTNTSYGNYLASSGVPAWAIAITPGATSGGESTGGGGESSGGSTGMYKGGVTNGAYISGERGPELNIPLGDKTIVLNQKQLKAAGIDIKKLMSGASKPEKFAEGGVFDQGWGNVTDPDRTMAMQFLNDALAKARAGTPWQRGALPSPVYASSPGMSPIVSQTLGSLTAMAQGIPAEYFQELATRYRPSGVRESVTQRTA